MTIASFTARPRASLRTDSVSPPLWKRNVSVAVISPSVSVALAARSSKASH